MWFHAKSIYTKDQTQWKNRQTILIFFYQMILQRESLMILYRFTELDVLIRATTREMVTFWHVGQTMTRISLRIREVWSEYSLSTWRRNFVSLAIQNAPSADFDQTVQLRRLIWILVGRTCPTVRFPTFRLISYLPSIFGHCTSICCHFILKFKKKVTLTFENVSKINSLSDKVTMFRSLFGVNLHGLLLQACLSEF